MIEKSEKLTGLTISGKMKIFGVLIFAVVLAAGVFKYTIATNADKNFDIYSKKAVDGKFLVLEIGKELNYISRCTRDIMLGNSYESNLAKIEKSRDILVKAFAALRLTIKNTPNEDKKLAELDESMHKTLAFVDDGYNKMKSLEKIERTPAVLASVYQEYKKDATPLANASRDAFQKIIVSKENGLKLRTEQYHKEMNSLINFIFIESIIVMVLIMGYLIFLTRNITVSLDKFKMGLISFFDFLDKKTQTIEPISIQSKDEFGQMALLLNSNVQKIQTTLQEEQKLIDEASIVIGRVKHGWYSQTIETTTSSQTLNVLKEGINEMINATKAHFVTINETLEEYSNYNYTKKLEVKGVEKGGVFDILITDINKVQAAINSMLQESKNNGVMLDESATTLLMNVNQLDKSSNETATRLEETAAALEQVTGNIKSSTEKISQMSSIANSVTVSANKGEKLASRTATSMEEINQKVSAINDAINVIDQIAFQTNILSLNAAVEAATAGEAGKGFAVVAAEVRNLASRSAEAAKEIKALVEDANTKANAGKSISSEMIEGYVHLNNDIKKTIDLISDITVSAQEQKVGVEQINDAINNLDKQTQENAAIARVANDISQKTSEIAKDILKNTRSKKFEENISVKANENYAEDKKDKKDKILKSEEPVSSSKKQSNSKQDNEWETF
ncbi:MAG: methyl-accepting chemotaxis protein [Arcobacteraceae bacterium]